MIVYKECPEHKTFGIPKLFFTFFLFNPLFVLQINTPNAGNNIYGNSNQDTGRNNLNNSMEHVLPSKNLEKNSLLKIPNFTLQDVEFLEELGEGAFGKMITILLFMSILETLMRFTTF